MNTVLAELWEENHDVPTDARALWNRCEPFESEAPGGVALITAGVDVQADRLEEHVVVDRRRPLAVLLPQAGEAAVAAGFG